jgi:type IV pilus assembly protein PilV
MKRGSRAYTFVEVMISMAVFSIGAAGVIAMQRVAVQSNVDARMFDVANSIARQWVERVKVDASRWTIPNRDDDGTSCTASATAAGCYESSLLIAPTSAWRFPNDYAATLGWREAADILGHDVGPTSDDAAFCTQIKVQILDASSKTADMKCSVPTSGGASLGGCIPNVVQVDVRVYWPRKLGDAYSEGCNDTQPTADITPDTANSRAYHYVYATTAIRKTSVQ